MDLVVKIHSDHLEATANPRGCAARALRQIADDVATADDGIIRDANGRRIGRWVFDAGTEPVTFDDEADRA